MCLKIKVACVLEFIILREYSLNIVLSLCISRMYTKQENIVKYCHHTRVNIKIIFFFLASTHSTNDTHIYI
jgi:hypothetical protein